jgi:D-alanyl-lipoteichoic acid acyltransferase DltB (MBOAT superfamily)
VSPAGKQLVLCAELALAALVIRQFEIGGAAFVRLSTLALAGAVAHAIVPARWRLEFFVALSIASLYYVLGLGAGTWIVGIGLGILGICHLPLSLRLRVGLLIAICSLSVALRLDWLPLPFEAAVFPVLGSMFAFRTLIYLYDLRHEGVAWSPGYALAYFFLLPNVCFPLFPVIDFKTFRRSHLQDDGYWTSQVGLQWISRGIVHLVLYRAVYLYATIAPSDVNTITDVCRFVVTSFALYMRVSGIFHVVVGLLHLFGFALPETHHRYFLSTGVNDFWRRINIYWKDFMLKLFFYPAYFRLRRYGASAALVLATTYVVVMTWFLHACQWFWIEGSFPLRWQDAVFWTILAVLMTTATLWESHRPNRAGVEVGASGPRLLVAHAVRVAATFTGISILWSLWTSDSLEEWIAVWSVLGKGWAGETTSRAMAPIGAVVATVLLGVSAIAPKAPTARSAGALDRRSRGPSSFWRLAGATSATLGLLTVAGSPALWRALALPMENEVAAVRSAALNQVDLARLQRGYYEDLMNVDRFSSRLWELTLNRPSGWRGLPDTAAVRATDDYRIHELLPFANMVFKGARFHTNGWGMRDQEYSRTKPPGTYRIALLGGSFVMGSGIADDETFETILEEHLNRDFTPRSELRYEILNFATGASGPLQRLLTLELKAFAFQPDAVLYVTQTGDFTMAVHNMRLALERDIAPPYPFVRRLMEQAGIRKGMSESEMLRRLRPHAEALLSWVEQTIASECAQRGALPIWVWLPALDPAKRAEAPRHAPAGFAAMDLQDVFDERDLARLRVRDWDFHPNAEGHRMIAERLYDEIVKRGGIDLLRPGAREVTATVEGQ